MQRIASASKSMSPVGASSARGEYPAQRRVTASQVLATLKKHVSMVLVEQNLALALSVADRVHVLSRGQIVHSGTPGELMSGDGEYAALHASWAASLA